MTIPAGYVSTSQAAEMLGFNPDLFGRQYLSLVFRYSDTAPTRYGVANKNLHYKKSDVTKWLKNNDVKQALKHARQMVNGKKPVQPIDHIQQLRINFITGKLHGKNCGKNNKTTCPTMD